MTCVSKAARLLHSSKLMTRVGPSKPRQTLSSDDEEEVAFNGRIERKLSLSIQSKKKQAQMVKHEIKQNIKYHEHSPEHRLAKTTSTTDDKGVLAFLTGVDFADELGLQRQTRKGNLSVLA